jgi:hypothetical protein
MVQFFSRHRVVANGKSRVGFLRYAARMNAMNDPRPYEQGLLVGPTILLMVAGVIWRCISVENVDRIWQSILARPSGPLAFRFIVQPLMAAIVAVHDGLQDAKRGRSPFLWTILSNPLERRGQLIEELNATARILLLGLAIDTSYQTIVFKAFLSLRGADHRCTACILAVLADPRIGLAECRVMDAHSKRD